MSKDELVARYRNLLVALARNRSSLVAEVATLRQAATYEQNIGRRSGLLCKANALSKHSFLMEALIRRNNLALRHLFNTTDINSVAQHEFLIHKTGPKPYLPQN